MKADDGSDAGVQDDGHEQDEAEARQDLGAQKLEGGERGRVQPFQKPALAVPQHHVADAEQAAEHHVHAENAREEPVDVTQRGAGHRLAARARLGSEQQLLEDVTLG